MNSVYAKDVIFFYYEKIEFESRSDVIEKTFLSIKEFMKINGIKGNHIEDLNIPTSKNGDLVGIGYIMTFNKELHSKLILQAEKNKTQECPKTCLSWSDEIENLEIEQKLKTLRNIDFSPFKELFSFNAYFEVNEHLDYKRFTMYFSSKHQKNITKKISLLCRNGKFIFKRMGDKITYIFDMEIDGMVVCSFCRVMYFGDDTIVCVVPKKRMN